MKLPIPLEALEDAGIVLGRRGAGKSNALMCLFEHELDAGHRAVMVDPKGDRWGIRMACNGSPSRFNIPIFGGEHHDIPLNEDMGEQIGRLVAEHDLSCLIDLSLMSLAGKQRFMMGFAPELLQRNRAALTLFIEEVDQFANQDPRYQPAMLVHHIANFATLGRQRGIVPWVASQRPAKVNATVRSQADTFIGMKVTSPLDRDAFREWFKGHGKEAASRVDEEIGRLSPGEALVWVGATEFFDRVKFPLASTFDSGRTPKHGETIAAVELAPIDLGEIRAALAPVESQGSAALEAGESQGRAALRARIADLETERDALRQACERKDRRIVAVEDERDRLRHIIEQVRTWVAPSANEIPASGQRRAGEETAGQTEGYQAVMSATPRAKPQRQRQTHPQGVTAGETATVMNAAARKMLDMLDRIAPACVPWGSLAAMIGNKARGGNFNAARKALRESGRIIEDGDTVRSAAPPTQGMSRDEAFQLWLGVLGNPAPRMMQALQGRALTKEQLGVALGIVPRGGNFNNGVAQLLRNGVAVDRGGALHLADPLPGEAA